MLRHAGDRIAEACQRLGVIQKREYGINQYPDTDAVGLRAGPIEFGRQEWMGTDRSDLS
jgi:hypothetical protein